MRTAGTRSYSGVLRSSVECIVVPGAGIEPAWPCGRRILSPMRLPVSPSGHGDSLPHSHRIGKRRPSARRKQRSPACGASTCFPGKRTWSGKRDSNSRPRPWQGRALPTELFPRADDANIVLLIWRPRAESNRCKRICNPVHHHSATRPNLASDLPPCWPPHFYSAIRLMATAPDWRNPDTFSRSPHEKAPQAGPFAASLEANLERETRLELATPTLARSCSTN
jgi:hypothetical protein